MKRALLVLRGVVAVQHVLSQKSVKVQEFDYEQMRVSGFSIHYKAVLRSRSKSKNRDKQLTFIVRVIVR